MIAIKKEDLVHVASTFTYYTSTMSKLSNETRIIITAFLRTFLSVLRSCVKVEVAVPLGPLSLIVL